MNIFKFSDYRSLLRAIVRDRKRLDPNFGFHVLASAANVQRPYLSKVMKGDADLNSDQIYLIATHLKLDAEEQEHVQLLLEYERTSIPERKNALGDLIAMNNEISLDSAAYLGAKVIDTGTGSQSSLQDYYLDPLMQVVHLAISIERFGGDVPALAGELRIPETQLQVILERLENMGLAVRENNRFVPREPKLHLSKSSPIYRAWRNQIKLLSAQRINQLTEQEAYSFSVLFSADVETRNTFHMRFLELLKNCEADVRDAPPKQVFQMSFDLFPWTS